MALHSFFFITLVLCAPFSLFGMKNESGKPLQTSPSFLNLTQMTQGKKSSRYQSHWQARKMLTQSLDEQDPKKNARRDLTASASGLLETSYKPSEPRAIIPQKVLRTRHTYALTPYEMAVRKKLNMPPLTRAQITEPESNSPRSSGSSSEEEIFKFEPECNESTPIP